MQIIMVVESMIKSVLTAYDGLVIKSSFGSQCACPGGAAAQILSPVSSECGGKDRQGQDDVATVAVPDINKRACEPSTSSNHERLNHPPESREHHPSDDQRQAEDDQQQQQQEDRIDDPNPNLSNTPTVLTCNDGYGLIPEKDCGVPTQDSKKAYTSTARSRPPIARPWSTSSKKKTRSTNNHKVASSDGSRDSTSVKGVHFFSVSDEMILGGAAVTPGRDERSDDYFSSCTLSSSNAASEDLFDEDAHDSPSYSPVRDITSSLSTMLPSTSAAAGGDVGTITASSRSTVCALSPLKTPPIITKSHLSLDRAQRVTIHDTPGSGGPFSPAHSSCTNPSYISSSSSSEGGVLSDNALSEGDDIISNDARARSRHSNIDDSGLSNEVDTEDSKEWLKLDSLSGDGRPMAVVLATVTALLPQDDADQEISANTRRLVTRLSSSSISLASKEDSGRGVASPTSFRGGLTTLDTILVASSSLSVDTETDEFVLDNDTNQNKVSTGIGTSTKNSKSEMSEISESLLSALKQLDIDEEDGYGYTSTENKGTKESDTTTAANRCNSATNEIQGVDAEESGVREANRAENSDESSLSLSSVDGASFLSGKESENSTEAATRNLSKEISSMSPGDTPPELRTVDVAMVPGARSKTQANMVHDSLSDLSVSMPPLDDSSMRFTGNMLETRCDSRDMVQIREQELRKKMCLAVKELEEEYQERADEVRRQHEKKLQRLKRRLDLDLQRRAEYLRFGRASRSIIPRSEGTRGNCAGTGITEHIVNSKDVSDTKDNKEGNHSNNKSEPIVSETKKRKEEMEERLHNLLNRLHSPREQEAAHGTDTRKVETPREANKDESGTDTSPFDGKEDADGSLTKVSGVSNQKEDVAAISRAIANELHEERKLFELVLNNEAIENQDRLELNCVEIQQEQVRAVKEIEALKELLQSQQEQFNKDFTQAEEVSKHQVDNMERNLQHVKDSNEGNCLDLCAEIENNENAICALHSKLEKMSVCNDSLEEKLDSQATEVASVKAESNAFQARVAELTKIAERVRMEQEKELQGEVEKLAFACNQVRQEVSAAIDRQYSEGNRKRFTLEDEQNKITERMGALKKLLLIKEASTASMVEDWCSKETNLADKYEQLAEAITFAEEKSTNKTAAFTRVVAQLNSSHDDLSATIEETRQETDRILKQRREVHTEISSLNADNKQVEDWVNELMTVIDTLEKRDQMML